MKKIIVFICVLLVFALAGCTVSGDTHDTSEQASESVLEIESTLESISEDSSEDESESESENRSESESESETVGEDLGDREKLQLISIEMKDIYGDATLIKYGDYEMLVDAGKPSDKATVQNILREYCEDGVLEMLVATHAHDDHIGGISSSSFFSGAGIESVEVIVDFGYTYSTGAYNKYVSARNALIADGSEYYPISEMVADEEISDIYYMGDEEVFVEFFDTGNYVSPGTKPSGDLNQTSIALCVNYYDTQIFMAGDLTKSAEKDLARNISTTYGEYFPEENTVIYKASHHGSTGSNGYDILNLLKPDMIWISAAITGSNRTSAGVTSEQHPHDGTLLRLKIFTKDIYWNGINGTTVFDITGSGISVNGMGRTINYYSGGSIVDPAIEKNVTYLESDWYKG